MPGMSANPLIFKMIKFSEKKYKIHFLKWIKPVLNESIENYSKRLLNFIVKFMKNILCKITKKYSLLEFNKE